jgi:hypothetical protein
MDEIRQEVHVVPTAPGISRSEFKEDLKDFKKDMRREVALMIAAGSAISGIAAGWVAKSPAQAQTAALTLIHHVF